MWRMCWTVFFGIFALGSREDGVCRPGLGGR